MAGPSKDRKPDAFLSYARLDDEVTDGYISWLRERLEGQVNAEIGKGSFSIFQDTDEIPAGANWTSALEEALAGARFLIPVLSPSYFASQPCLFELAKFHGYENSAGRKDLIIPILFRDAPEYWEDLNNPHASLLRERQIFDWRSLRKKRRDDSEVLNSIEHLATDIRRALLRTSIIARATDTPIAVITAPEALATMKEELHEARSALKEAKLEAERIREQSEKDTQSNAEAIKHLRTELDSTNAILKEKISHAEIIENELNKTRLSYEKKVEELNVFLENSPRIDNFTRDKDVSPIAIIYNESSMDNIPYNEIYANKRTPLIATDSRNNRSKMPRISFDFRQTSTILSFGSIIGLVLLILFAVNKTSFQRANAPSQSPLKTSSEPDTEGCPEGMYHTFLDHETAVYSSRSVNVRPIGTVKGDVCYTWRGGSWNHITFNGQDGYIQY